MPINLSGYFEACLEILTGSPTDEFFAQIPTSRGVVLFADSTDNPIQLLTAASIRRTTKSHLLSGDSQPPARRADIKGITAKVYYSRCYCDFRSLLACYKAAAKIYPADYKDYVSLGKMWYLRIDLSAKWPCFSISQKPDYGNKLRVFGPFVTRKSAARFQNAAEDAFGMCKKPELLGNGRRFASCPYLQMDTCCGVCSGKISDSGYLAKIMACLEAMKNVSQAQQEFKEQMVRCAAAREFEKAQVIKGRMENLAIFGNRDYQWIRQIDSLAIVHIDKSGKIKLPGKRKMAQTYAAFLIDANGVKDFGDFLIEDLPKIFKLIQKAKQRKRKTASRATVDMFNLAGFYLYRSNSPGVWAAAQGDSWQGRLTENIERKFELQT
ncbi:MAG: hypothetical protein K8R02_09445 [Anaerohalosphaeraceae bacterium]|nr:hypothetical protein [Anaerohalosphaeraceae bacterium]